MRASRVVKSGKWSVAGCLELLFVMPAFQCRPGLMEWLCCGVNTLVRVGGGVSFYRGLKARYRDTWILEYKA